MVNSESIKADMIKNLSIYFENIYMQNEGKNISAQKDKIKIGFDVKHTCTGNKLDIKLYCRVRCEDIFLLDMCLAGSFVIGGEFTENRVLPNAIAIMFPYLRSQISIMTAQPNMCPIILPAMNINKFINKEKQNG